MPTGVLPQTALFLRTIWGEEPLREEDTYVYVGFGLRDRNTKKFVQWDREFYVWPREEATILADIERRRPQEEVYFTPSLLRERDAVKESALGSWVYWVDFDGDVPTDLKGVPTPTIKIQTSDGHEHWYWRTDEFSSPDTTELKNRSFIHALGAGDDCWDCTRILRPPNTFNHKRKATVKVIELNDIALPVGLFDSLPEPPPVQEISSIEIEDLPNATEVVFKYRFPDYVTRLFTSTIQGPTGGEEGGRSTTLMSLAFAFAEMGMKNDEIVSLLNNCCERWGKFAGRPDKIEQLTKITAIARRKYPWVDWEAAQEQKPLELMGFKSLLQTEIKLEWVWNGWLQKSGYMLFTGPPGVGKTQASIDMGCQFALGKNSWGRVVTKPHKIAFFSLEMGLTDLKEFMVLLGASFTPEEQEILEESFMVLPLGEPLYLNRDETKTAVEQMIGDYKLDGIIIDSLSSTVEGEIKDELTAKRLMDWNDRMRQKFNCFSWIIHHHRKGNSTNKKPNKLDDVYGPYLLTARATSVFCMWPTLPTTPNIIEVIPLKVRLSQKPDPFYVKRDTYLHFDRVSSVALGLAADSPATKSATSLLEVPSISVVDEPITETSARGKFEI